jgi:biotin transporter BioY
MCVIPFLPGDAVKIIAAALLAGRLRAPLRAGGWAE